MNSETPESAELVRRLSQLEEELRNLKRTQQSRRKLGLIVLGVVGLGVTIGTAAAANGNCPNGMPFCFSANQPAVASEVNQNFAQLKEWLEAKVGTVGTAVTIPAAATFNAGVTAATVTTTGAATVAGTLSANSTLNVAGTLNANGGLNVAGTVYQTGFETSCMPGAVNFIFPSCCRINVRNGQTSCHIATNWQTTAWTASLTADPFAATTQGAYSLACLAGVPSGGFPTCCRTDKVSGSVTCRSGNDWTLSSWGATGNPF